LPLRKGNHTRRKLHGEELNFEDCAKIIWGKSNTNPRETFAGPPLGKSIPGNTSQPPQKKNENPNAAKHQPTPITKHVPKEDRSIAPMFQRSQHLPTHTQKETKRQGTGRKGETACLRGSVSFDPQKKSEKAVEKLQEVPIRAPHAGELTFYVHFTPSNRRGEKGGNVRPKTTGKKRARNKNEGRERVSYEGNLIRGNRGAAAPKVEVKIKRPEGRSRLKGKGKTW